MPFERWKVRIIPSAKFRNEAAKFTMLFVGFKTRIRARIVGLQAQEFVGGVLSDKSERGDFIAAITPILERLLASEEQVFVIRADCGLEGMFLMHTFLPQQSQARRFPNS
jgi:hypothetical protein